MVHSVVPTPATVALPGSDPEPSVACPMCHTGAPLTQAALARGDSWRCVRCGQHWDAHRLAAVAAYAVWTAERDR